MSTKRVGWAAARLTFPRLFACRSFKRSEVILSVAVPRLVLKKGWIWAGKASSYGFTKKIILGLRIFFFRLRIFLMDITICSWSRLRAGNVSQYCTLNRGVLQSEHNVSRALVMLDLRQENIHGEPGKSPWERWKFYSPSNFGGNLNGRFSISQSVPVL